MIGYHTVMIFNRKSVIYVVLYKYINYCIMMDIVYTTTTCDVGFNLNVRL